MKRTFEKSIVDLARWVETHDYSGYDPGDGDLSFLRHLTFGSHFAGRLLTAAVLRSPVHIRPWIGIRPHTSTKAMGYFGWGYTKMFGITREEVYRERAQHCYEWLMSNRSPGWQQYCWGNAFAFSTRAGTIPRYMPTIVWSSLIGLSFLEAYEVFGRDAYLAVAKSVAEWILALPRETTSRGACLSYVPFRQSSIHNANMLGGCMLARVAQHTKCGEMLDVARDSFAYSCAAQCSDGAWRYGEDSRYHWIDNFHTGYNLDSLKVYTDTVDRQFESNLNQGVQYFKRAFFEGDGCPKYYHDKKYPIDIQCAAQAIDTLSTFSDRDPDAMSLAVKVARWTIDHMQAPDGHFYYRDLGWIMVRTPMLHWGQGTMFKALANLLSKLGDDPGDRD